MDTVADESGSGRDNERRHEFGVLYSAYAGCVLGYALRRVPRADAEDMVGDVFLTAWRRLADVPADPLPWLLATARNVLRNQRRSDHRRGTLVARVSRDTQQGELTDPADSVVEAERARAALKQLTGSQREAVLLLAWEGLTRDQAAAVLGCSRAALAVRLHRARGTLSAALDQIDQIPVPRADPSASNEPIPMEEQR